MSRKVKSAQGLFARLSGKVQEKGGVHKLNNRDRADYNRLKKDPRMIGASSSVLGRAGYSGPPVGASSSLVGRSSFQGGYQGPQYGPATPGAKSPFQRKTPAAEVDSGPGGIETKDGWRQKGLVDKGGALGSWGMNNVQASLRGDQTVLGVAAGHAIRGAVGGGAIGGTVEAAQGGSFWDGAKAGAFNGAVGWGGYRMGMRATGATSYNPLAGINSKNPNKQGLVTAAGRMVNSVSNQGKISKQAATLLNHEQRLGLQQSIYNAGKKV